MYIYPSRGQSPQQQIDQGQCYSWAVQQSGFNPANPQIPGGPPPAAGAPQGGLFRGAAGGAALGAIGGAIGGNAGKGAAIGAATFVPAVVVQHPRLGRTRMNVAAYDAQTCGAIVEGPTTRLVLSAYAIESWTVLW
jgi:hypothetical protein